MSFGASVRSFVVKTNEKIEGHPKKVALLLSQKIISRTPVSSGLLRGSWRASAGSPNLDIPTTTDPSGSNTLSMMKAEIDRWKNEKSLFLMNCQPYAVPIEYGHSKQRAPAGMVRISIAEVSNVH